MGQQPRVSPKFLLHRAQHLIANGRLAEACEAAAAAQETGSRDPSLLDAVGTVFSRANEQSRALAAYDRAISLAPTNPQFIFNRAAVRRFLGQLTEAQADYDQVIGLNPTDYEAYKNRSDLCPQTPDSNHVEPLERVIAQGIPDWRGEVLLRYALAKEYEDLGNYDRSFFNLRKGARLRRDHFRYDIRVDVATADWIIEAFPAGPEVRAPSVPSAPESPPPSVSGPPARAPIFIVGLPRSGSTLVDRILGSHSRVRSAGELNCFALALVAGVRRQTGPAPIPRKELVARSATLDFAALGRDYMERARAAGATAEAQASAGPGTGASAAAGLVFTDKMPLNYLYCGLIQRALPHAKIVHVTRHPMAVCYAMFKTLFEDGYPFSYDLSELAEYYLSYRRLMQHWEDAAPGTLHTVSYEDLIADQAGQTRSLLESCGLNWQPACLDFQHNVAATTTASASQVRRPLYDSSVSQWRRYEQHLAPLKSQLIAGGVDMPD